MGLWVFGENFPAATDPPAEQVFSLLTAATGLAAFALILALVEQVPLNPQPEPQVLLPSTEHAANARSVLPQAMDRFRAAESY